MELSSLLEQTPYLFFVVIATEAIAKPANSIVQKFLGSLFTKRLENKVPFPKRQKTLLPQRLDYKVECIVGKGHAVLGQGLCSPRVYAAQALLYEVEAEVGIAVGFQVA